MPRTAATLTVTSKGQITIRRSVLEHLGVGPGDRLQVDLLPGGRAEMRAAARGRIDDFIGALARPGQPSLSIEEIGQIAADGWAGKR